MPTNGYGYHWVELTIGHVCAADGSGRVSQASRPGPAGWLRGRTEDKGNIVASVADQDPGSGVFLRSGSRIPNPYFWELGDNIWGVKTSIIFGKLGKFFSSAYQKWSNIQFCEICGYKKGMTTKKISPLSFVAVFISEIRDPGWVKIRIRDLG